MSTGRLSSCAFTALAPSRECRDQCGKRLSRSLHLSNRTRSSPTANILRTSRLFSVPKPLPTPQIEVQTASGLSKVSDSATLPYPVQQAIATPKSSLARGDWGLKRPLPLRSTTSTSTPAFRISSIDTIEHITEFESAADHTQTLQKWQQLNIPLTTDTTRAGKASSYKRAGRSVFEQDIDNTDPAVDADSTKKRWKHKGPWIAGMTDGEFETYIKREIRDMRDDFKRMLMSKIRERLQSDRVPPLGADGTRPRNSSRVSEEDIADRLKALRDGLDTNNTTEPLNSELTSIIRDYLDLPPLQASSQESSQLASFLEAAGAQQQIEPPTTHASAGLSYLRTAAFLDNHPVLGPQSSHAPVQARVLQPKNVGGGGSQTARLGVAGFTVNYTRTERGPETGVDQLDLDAQGGTKIWVVPKRAHVDSTGRILLDVDRADSVTELVHLGKARHQSMQPGVPVSGRPMGVGRLDGALDRRAAAPVSKPFGKPGDRPGQVNGEDALSFISQLAQSQGKN